MKTRLEKVGSTGYSLYGLDPSEYLLQARLPTKRAAVALQRAVESGSWTCRDARQFALDQISKAKRQGLRNPEAQAKGSFYIAQMRGAPLPPVVYVADLLGMKLETDR